MSFPDTDLSSGFREAHRGTWLITDKWLVKYIIFGFLLDCLGLKNAKMKSKGNIFVICSEMCINVAQCLQAAMRGWVFLYLFVIDYLTPTAVRIISELVKKLVYLFCSTQGYSSVLGLGGDHFPVFGVLLTHRNPQDIDLHLSNIE